MQPHIGSRYLLTGRGRRLRPSDCQLMFTGASLSQTSVTEPPAVLRPLRIRLVKNPPNVGDRAVDICHMFTRKSDACWVGHRPISSDLRKVRNMMCALHELSGLPWRPQFAAERIGNQKHRLSQSCFGFCHTVPLNNAIHCASIHTSIAVH